MSESFGTKQQYNKRNERNVVEAIITNKAVCFKGLFGSSMDAIQIQRLVDQSQARVSRPVVNYKVQFRFMSIHI